MANNDDNNDLQDLEHLLADDARGAENRYRLATHCTFPLLGISTISPSTKVS